MTAYNSREVSVTVSSRPRLSHLFERHLTRAKISIIWFLTGDKITPTLEMIVSDTMNERRQQLRENIFKPTPILTRIK